MLAFERLLRELGELQQAIIVGWTTKTREPFWSRIPFKSEWEERDTSGKKMLVEPADILEIEFMSREAGLLMTCDLDCVAQLAREIQNLEAVATEEGIIVRLKTNGLSS